MHPPGVVETLQRGDRPARGSGTRCRSRPRGSSARCARPAEQRHPPRRESVTPSGYWCDGARMTSRARGRARAPASTSSPSVVDRHRDRAGRGAEHRPPRAQVARLLQPDRVARVDHQAQHLLERLLRAAGDEDLLGNCSGTPRAATTCSAIARRNPACPAESPPSSSRALARDCVRPTSRDQTAMGKRSSAGSPGRKGEAPAEPTRAGRERARASGRPARAAAKTATRASVPPEPG